MTETHFLLGVINDAGPSVEARVPIEEEEYDRLRDSGKRVVQFLEQQSFALVARNYHALEVAFEALREGPIAGPAGAARQRFFEFRLVVLDWLLATRLFLDHTLHELCDQLGSKNRAVRSWDDARRAEHAAHRGYRILYDLRDYCAHKGMPPLHYHAHENMNGERATEVTLEPVTLLRSFDWKRHARADLQAAAGSLDFEELAAEYMGCLSRLAGEAQEQLAPDVLDDARHLLDAAEKVSGLDGHPTALAFQEVTDSKNLRMQPVSLPINAAQQVLALFGTR